MIVLLWNGRNGINWITLGVTWYSQFFCSNLLAYLFNLWGFLCVMHQRRQSLKKPGLKKSRRYARAFQRFCISSSRIVHPLATWQTDLYIHRRIIQGLDTHCHRLVLHCAFSRTWQIQHNRWPIHVRIFRYDFAISQTLASVYWCLSVAPTKFYGNLQEKDCSQSENKFLDLWIPTGIVPKHHISDLS